MAEIMWKFQILSWIRKMTEMTDLTKKKELSENSKNILNFAKLSSNLFNIHENPKLIS